MCSIFQVFMLNPFRFMFFFFVNDTATTEIYTLSLHDALPIWFASRTPYRSPETQKHGERDRRAKPENRRPSPSADQRTADQRPQRRSQRENHRKRRRRATALLFGVEGGHESRGDADHQPRPDPLQKAAEQQPAIGRCCGA